MEEKTIVIKQGSFGSFLRGMIIGGVIALLLAPRSGRETRQMLNDKSTEIKGKATGLVNDTRDRAQSVISDARSKIEDTMKNVKEGADTSTQNDTVRELKRELEITEDINNPNYPL